MFMAIPIKATPARPAQCNVFMPQLLKEYIVRKTDLDDLANSRGKAKDYGQKTESTNMYWKVYSDRSNNACYENPKGNDQCGTLGFGEEVRIAQIENGRALVFSVEGTGFRYPQIPANAKIRGWVPMENLLLWSLCPANEHYIYNKALIVANIDVIKKDGDFGFFFQNPQTKEGKKDLSSTMNFFYVMKTDKATGKVLLSKESIVGGKVNSFYGWVSPGTYIEWNERTCLELTWDTQARSQLKEAGITSIPIKNTFNDKVFNRIVLNEKNKVSSGTPQDQWRMDPHMLRYPLLSTEPDEYCATVFAKDGQVTNTNEIEKVGRAEEILDAGIDDMRSVNIIVVIDGTKGMENCFKFVERAIERAYKELFLKENREVRVGGVIYRDYGYTQGGNQYTYEVFPLCNIKDPNLKKFFAGGKFGIRNTPTDKSDYEALYLGLSKALDEKTMNYKAGNSNLMFVIGDCGNRRNDAQGPTEEELIAKCVKNRIQLSAFQVRNPDTPESNMFQLQMGRVVRENMERQYKALGSQVEVKYEDMGYGTDFVPNLEEKETFFIGGYRYPSPNTDLDEARLYALLESTARRFDNAMARQLIRLDEGITGSESQIERKFLKDYLGAEAFNLLEANKYMMAYKCMIPQKSNGGIAYWKPVIYISKREFSKLMEGLGIVNSSIDKESINLRHDYVEGMKRLVRAMLPGVSETQMNQMSNDRIMNQIEGLNVKTKAISYSLTDIMDPNAVSDDKFQALISDFSEKYRILQRIRDQKYTFSTKRSGELHYWIPAEMLP